MAVSTGVVGMQHVAGVASALRKYDQSDKFWLIRRSYHPFSNLLLEKFPKVKVTETEFKEWEQDYLTIDGTLQGDDGTGAAAAITDTNTYMNITNADKVVQPGDVLHVPSRQTNQTAAMTGHLLAGENMLVTAVSGAVVTVVRNLGGATGNDVNAGSGNTLKWYKLPTSRREGASALESFAAPAPTQVSNYTQIFSESVEVSRSALRVKTYGEDERTKQRKLKLYNLHRQVERMFLFGRKAVRTENGKERRFMGGVASYIKDGAYVAADAWMDGGTLQTDGTLPVWMIKATSNFTRANFHKFTEMAFLWGNPEKFAFCGPTFLTNFSLLFEDMYRINESDSKRFGMNIYEFESPHGLLRFIREPEMVGAYANDCFILDLEYLRFAYLDDLAFRADIQAKADDEVKDEWLAEISLKRTGTTSTQSVHSWITGYNWTT